MPTNFLVRECFYLLVTCKLLIHINTTITCGMRSLTSVVVTPDLDQTMQICFDPPVMTIIHPTVQHLVTRQSIQASHDVNDKAQNLCTVQLFRREWGTVVSTKIQKVIELNVIYIGLWITLRGMESSLVTHSGYAYIKMTIIIAVSHSIQHTHQTACYTRQCLFVCSVLRYLCSVRGTPCVCVCLHVCMHVCFVCVCVFTCVYACVCYRMSQECEL